MKTKICTTDDLAQIVSIVSGYRYLYGIDIVETGFRDFHIQTLSSSFSNPNQEIIAAVGDDDNILGFCLQHFFPHKKVWMIRCCYIAPFDSKTHYNASRIGGPILEAMCKNAESMGYFDFYYVVRDLSNNKRLGMTLSATDYVREKYAIDNIETIPPNTKSISEQRGKFLLGELNGLQTVPLLCRHGYLK
jgi:hypothetical protein